MKPRKDDPTARIESQSRLAFTLLCDLKEVAPYLDRVVAIGDENSEELGFLPYPAYQELAAKSQIWVAVDEKDELLGYLAFGGSNSALKISQLYVHPAARRLRVGSALIERLKTVAHETYMQVISARVATELPANRFWERQGFYVIRQVPGGKTTGRILNIRVFEIPRGSLLEVAAHSPIEDWLRTPQSQPVLFAPTYSLDMNVVFDVVQERADADLMKRVFSASFDGEIRLCVSSEFIVELKRKNLPPESDPLLKLASSLPILPQVAEEALEPTIAVLRNLIFPDRDPARKHAKNDLSDLKHLAICVYHKVRGFITREQAILRSASMLREKFELDVLSPFDVVSLSTSPSEFESYVAIRRSDREVKALPFAQEHHDDVRDLCNYLGIHNQFVDGLLDAGTTAVRRNRLVVYSGQLLVGFAAWNEPALRKSTVRAYVLIRESAAESPLAIDHCIGSIINALPDGKFSQCELWMAASQNQSFDTAQRLGFWGDAHDAARNFRIFSKHAFNGLIMPESWPEFANQFHVATGTTLQSVCPSNAEGTTTGILLSKRSQSSKRAIDLFAFESELSPLLLLLPDRTAVLVPIRDKQASELLPMVQIQCSLFGKEALVHIERAYFGSLAAKNTFVRGGLVIFYVSGAERGRGEAVGIGRITSVGSGSPTQLHLDLLRQGVLSVDDLSRMSRKSNAIHYFTFDAFKKFERGVPFKELKEIGCVGPANLITSQPLEFDKLVMLLKRSSKLEKKR
jgi:GNAT superfamily N-acetyltransferase